VANLIVSAVSTFDNKGLKKGQKEISAFDKSVKKLARTFAATFGTAAIINFGKKSVQAFMADEKAAKALEQQLKNVGYQFSAPGVEKYIASLQQATGVLDDQLRPAFQSLLTVTGSITQSQDALNTALNISAATGKSVVEVSQALAKGYAGQTTALSRLGAGLSKATLQSGDMNKIMNELNNKFAGQSAARLNTYAGKMDLLKVSAENAKEEIGKGLLDALSLLSKDNSIQTATDLMDGFAQSTSDAIYGIAVLIKKLEGLQKLPGGEAIFNIKNIPVVGAWASGLSQLGASERSKFAPSNRDGRSTSRVFVQQMRLENKILEKQNKLRLQELAAMKAKSEVDKLAEKFDVERIGLMKALNEATDAETILRLNAKIAILDNNEALAKKINAELEAAKKAKELADAFGGAASALSAQIARMQAMNDALINKINDRIAAGTYTPPPGLKIPGISSMFPAAQGPLGGVDYTVPMGSGNPVYAPGSSGTPMSYADVRLTIDVAQSGDQFAQLIADSVQVAQRSGYSTTSAGSLNP
jgi:hypothetical protein